MVWAQGQAQRPWTLHRDPHGAGQQEEAVCLGSVSSQEPSNPAPSSHGRSCMERGLCFLALSWQQACKDAVMHAPGPAGL